MDVSGCLHLVDKYLASQTDKNMHDQIERSVVEDVARNTMELIFEHDNIDNVEMDAFAFSEYISDGDNKFRARFIVASSQHSVGMHVYGDNSGSIV